MKTEKVFHFDFSLVRIRKYFTGMMEKLRMASGYNGMSFCVMRFRRQYSVQRNCTLKYILLMYCGLSIIQLQSYNSGLLDYISNWVDFFFDYE